MVRLETRIEARRRFHHHAGGLHSSAADLAVFSEMIAIDGFSWNQGNDKTGLQEKAGHRCIVSFCLCRKRPAFLRAMQANLAAVL
ncbi:hypothetical protein [Paenibacillus turpanensis]|uniref:hypothetical protein n=1 Tax=Paenibacillus turpanensis TaxID=2689078 RepID=UPI00140C0E48|nr:hypothetical protein [Paenibacillus turpanensis]